MANAAAKKAAAARQAATNLYKPVFAIVNILYVYLRVIRNWETWTLGPILSSLVIWAITYFTYHGIIQDHENMVSITASKISSSKEKHTRLAGGIYLDILALLLVIQFGSLWNHNILWLLIIFPIWGVYTLYYSFFKGMLPSSTSNNVAPVEDATVDDKRRKRAEKRRHF